MMTTQKIQMKRDKQIDRCQAICKVQTKKEKEDSHIVTTNAKVDLQTSILD